MDVADINGNGVAEIYVCALDPYRKYVKSFVMEFSGKSYAEIVKDTDWYLRVVDMPQRGKVLIGQKQGLESPFDKPIFELVWQNSGYEPADRVMGSKRANVMGFSLGHVMDDGSEAAVVYDKLDNLRVYDSSGKQKKQRKDQDEKEFLEQLEESEKNTILRALEQTGGVQKEAAEVLGISRRAIHYKIKKYGIDAGSIKARH